MFNSLRRLLGGVAAVGIALAALSGGAAVAGPYPEKPVKIIVPFGAGGPTDLAARLVAQHLSERLGGKFVTENVPGAGGNIGTARAARSPADGYTLLVTSSGFLVNPSLYADVPYDPKKDFIPISLLGAAPNAVVVHKSVPAKTVKELIADIRANPKKYSFGHPVIGSTPHLSGERFKLQFGLTDYTMVPYSSAPQAISAIVAGQIPTAWLALPLALTAQKSGEVRILAVASEKRLAALPDVPTFAEEGIEGQESDTISGLFAVAGTPPEIVARLGKEIPEIIKLPEVASKLSAVGLIPVGSTPEEWRKRVDAEIEKWAKVIRDAKIPQIK